MTDRDAAAVHIDDVAVQPELGLRAGDHGPERLVDLHEIEVLRGDPLFPARLLDRSGRLCLERVVRTGGLAARADGHEHRPALGLGGRPRRDDHGGGAVRDLGRVARRDRAAFGEGGSQSRQGLHRGLGPHPLVSGHPHGFAPTLRHLDGDDLRVEHTALLRGGGPLMRERGDLVLGLPGEFVASVVPFRGRAHALPVVGIRQPVVGHVVEDLDGAVGPAIARSHEQVGCAGHGLHAGGDDDLRVPGPDHARRIDHGGEPGQAHLVHGMGGDVPADPGADGRLTGRVLTGSGSEHLSHDDRVDVRRVHSALLEGTADRERPQLRRRERGELPLQPPLRGARRGDDDDIVLTH